MDANRQFRCSCGSFQCLEWEYIPPSQSSPSLPLALGFPLLSSASRPEEMGTAAGAGGWARAARAAEMEDIRAKKRADEDPTQCIPSLGRGGGFCGPNLALTLTLGLQPCT